MEKKAKTAGAESEKARSLNRAAQRIAAHGKTSEKAIEAYLRRRVEAEGGICLKYSNPNQVGYPDRAVLLPGGMTLRVELKSTGEKPSKLQRERFREMESIGHSVTVLDSKEAVDRFMDVVIAAVLEADFGMVTDGLAVYGQGTEDAGKEAGDEV